jgi:hypothetical protein
MDAPHLCIHNIDGWDCKRCRSYGHAGPAGHIDALEARVKELERELENAERAASNWRWAMGTAIPLEEFNARVKELEDSLAEARRVARLLAIECRDSDGFMVQDWSYEEYEEVLNTALSYPDPSAGSADPEPSAQPGSPTPLQPEPRTPISSEGCK